MLRDAVFRAQRNDRFAANALDDATGQPGSAQIVNRGVSALGAVIANQYFHPPFHKNLTVFAPPLKLPLIDPAAAPLLLLAGHCGWIAGDNRIPLCRALSYLILTSTCFGFASSRLANVTRSIPSLNSALTLLVSTKFGSVKLRVNAP